MAYSGTWNYDGHAQTQGSVHYQHQQPDQYNQQYPHSQQQTYHQDNYQNQNQNNYQHNNYEQPPPPPPAYQPSPQWNGHDNTSQWNNNEHHYDDRSTLAPSPFQYQQQQQYQQHQQYQHHQQYQQQQPYVPAHSPYAPPTTVQTLNTSGMHYQYSDLHGTKKALLIGINYIGTEAELRGCINDVTNIREFLTQNYHFPAQNVWVMTDDVHDARSIPTKQNILDGMRWLVAGAKPGDNLFLQFSGHGGPVKDVDGDEDDGFDEAICPLDYKNGKNGQGFIVDDQIHDICVKPLPQGCRLTAIFDCCHSGSIMDLPFMYSTKGALKEPSIIKDTGLGLLQLGAGYAKQDLGSMLMGGASIVKKAVRHANGHHRKVRAAKMSSADVICFSGCKDEQQSADASISGQRQGAMSHAFKTSLLRHGGKLTYIQLLNAMREVVAQGGYKQKPQLSACHPLDLDLLFTL